MGTTVDFYEVLVRTFSRRMVIATTFFIATIKSRTKC